MQWRIQGRGPGPGAPSPLFIDQTEARRTEKFFWRPRPDLLTEANCSKCDNRYLTWLKNVKTFDLQKRV